MATVKASWIARQWKRGWTEIPLLMVGHCVTTPIVIAVIIARLTGVITLQSEPAKYRAEYTIIRSDDPRVSEIVHHTTIDKFGPFS